MSDPQVIPPLTFRITITHDYTPNPAHYAHGATVEDMLRLDGEPEAIDDVMDSVMARGDITRKIEVIHDGRHKLATG